MTFSSITFQSRREVSTIPIGRCRFCASARPSAPFRLSSREHAQQVRPSRHTGRKIPRKVIWARELRKWCGGKVVRFSFVWTGAWRVGKPRLCSTRVCCGSAYPPIHRRPAVLGLCACREEHKCSRYVQSKAHSPMGLSSCSHIPTCCMLYAQAPKSFYSVFYCFVF